MASLLTRDLSLASFGDDVYGVKRSVYRLLDAGDQKHRLRELETKSPATKRRYGPFFVLHVNQARKVLGFRQAGKVDQPFWAALVKGGWPDARAIELMNAYADAHPLLALVYPHPLGSNSSICQGLHPTAGLLGNEAIDFCASGGTSVFAVESAKIQRLSGHNPAEGDLGGAGIYGWSVYYRTSQGYVYFCTHMGTRVQGLNAGDSVQAGDLLGTVGHWPHNEGRSHTHLGVTSPLGIRDARKRITDVSKAPRI